MLAGIAQAMVAAKKMPDVDDWLQRTEAEHAAQFDGGTRVPKGFSEVALALKKDRAIFEAGGIFPAHVIDRILDVLDRQKEVSL